MTSFVLTERDMELLSFLEKHRSFPLPLLAERFFAKNPFTRTRNTNPLKACERRMTALRAHGYIELDRVRIAGKPHVMARVATKADNPLGVDASRRSIGTRSRVHHIRTIDAVHELERSVKARGGRVVSFTLEPQLRAREQRGRKTRRGDDFEPFPDAVCTVSLPDAGGEQRFDIAVEYVTSKYTSADIREKHESFRRLYKHAFWFADRDRTASRVRHITGGTCSILS
ncbi:MAG: hypothetical protein HYS27_22940 [Deltaproteobacteria bacterium]|nr:hypothetical protein [Deltaproteobacteria bacterium]